MIVPAFRLNGDYYSVTAAAAELGVTPARVRQLIGARQIATVRIDERTHLIPASEVCKIRDGSAPKEKSSRDA